MENELRISDFVAALKKRIGLIVVVTLLTTAGVGLYSTLTWTPLYQATTKILLPVDVSKPEFINTLGVVAKDSIVLDKVVQTLELNRLNRSSSTLNRQVSFSNEDASQVVRITVTDPDPELAAAIANTTANVFIREIGNVLGIYQAKVLSEAKVDSEPVPINVKPRRNMDIGFVAGIVLGIGLALFLDTLNTKIQSEKEAEKLLQLPVLGSVSKMNHRNTADKGKKQPISLAAKGGTIGGYKRTGNL